MDEQPKKKKDSIWKHAKIGTPIYSKASQLWDDALAYFEWCDDNPVDAPVNIIRYKKEKHGGTKEMKKQDQQENVSRPYTLFGLCAFTGITSWARFKAKYRDLEGFEDVILTIENVIASQQIDGALTGVFKENLTARMNGLAERQVADINGEVEVNENHKFSGFSFLPWTPGVENSDQSKIASGEVMELPEPEKEHVYAEIIDYIPDATS